MKWILVLLLSESTEHYRERDARRTSREHKLVVQLNSKDAWFLLFVGEGLEAETEAAP